MCSQISHSHRSCDTICIQARNLKETHKEDHRANYCFQCSSEALNLSVAHRNLLPNIGSQLCEARFEYQMQLSSLRSRHQWHVAPTHLQRAPEPLIQHPEGPNSPCWVFHPILHPSSGGPKASQPSSSSNVNQSCCAFPASAGFVRLNNDFNSIHEQTRPGRPDPEKPNPAGRWQQSTVTHRCRSPSRGTSLPE
jgi:hypothetical protein